MNKALVLKLKHIRREIHDMILLMEYEVRRDLKLVDHDRVEIEGLKTVVSKLKSAESEICTLLESAQ